MFQTGETFHRAPLIDYQHPHDLIMGLGAGYRGTHGRVVVLGGIDAVGSPTLGPPPFMHRPSARENPQAPLSHHYLDSFFRTRAGSFGVGADVTVYAVPAKLKESYGSPTSFHVFVRYRRQERATPIHIH